MPLHLLPLGLVVLLGVLALALGLMLGQNSGLRAQLMVEQEWGKWTDAWLREERDRTNLLINRITELQQLGMQWVDNSATEDEGDVEAQYQQVPQ
jgi:hypothetical protein